MQTTSLCHILRRSIILPLQQYHTNIGGTRGWKPDTMDSSGVLPAPYEPGACPAGIPVAFPDREHVANAIRADTFMGMENEKFTIAAAVKIKFFKIVHKKETMRRTAVIRRYYAFFPAEYIIGKPHGLTFHAVFA